MWWCETYRWEIYDEIDENRLFMANIAWLLVSYSSLMIMVPYALYIPFSNLQWFFLLKKGVKNCNKMSCFRWKFSNWLILALKCYHS